MTRWLIILSTAASLTVGLIACDPTPPSGDPDPYDSCPADSAYAAVTEASVVGDTLFVTVAHSGCDEAEVLPCWDGAFLESFPVQVNLDLSIGPPQACDAYFEFETEIDLTPLKQAYADSYQTQTGSISINLDGAGVLYEF